MRHRIFSIFRENILIRFLSEISRIKGVLKIINRDYNTVQTVSRYIIHPRQSPDTRPLYAFITITIYRVRAMYT